MEADPREALAQWLVGSVSAKGEQRMRCPLHDDSNPSASVNWSKGVWQCLGCKASGTVASLARQVHGKKATRPTRSRRRRRLEASGKGDQDGSRKPLSVGSVVGWHKALLDNEERLMWLVDSRCLDKDTIVENLLGWDGKRKRYTIPVYDAVGNLVNVRLYRGQPSQTQKFLNEPGHGDPARLYPITGLDYSKVVVLEGELDALLANQMFEELGADFGAVSGTHGAKTWLGEWSRLFAGKDVWVCFDNDDEGRRGAKRAADLILPHAASVRMVSELSSQEHGDVTDWHCDEEGTAEAFMSILEEAPLHGQRELPSGDAEAVPVQVIGSMDSETNGRPLAMSVTVVGRRDPTYSVPKVVNASCTMDAGPKCRVCPMNVDYMGEYDLSIQSTEAATILRLIDVTEGEVEKVIKKTIGIPPTCSVVKFTALENHSVEELFVMSSMDRQADRDTDYTQRKVYNVGNYDTRTNASALLTGTTSPSPKTRQNEFVSWSIQEETTSIDRFEMTPEMCERLRVFQPRRGQAPLDKCWEIAEDLSTNVTKIIGRERLHMAIDLVFHSVLHFPLDGKTISRGWLEFIVVGDTRTGKSETAIRMTEHYGLGHVIGCEGATFAGLVGGAKQIGNSWVVSWGEVTLNDRRLVVLDEASGLSQEMIGQLSDVRSRGMAQITKIETQQTNARTRMVWISNPRKSRVGDDRKHDGIDVIEDLIGNPEDIARFDFAMSVSMKDVPSSKINDPHRPEAPHVYTSELCRDLILWAWSRKAEDVHWQPAAYEHVYKMAEKLGYEFVDHPPLVQRTNVREKVARIAVALAARTFSTDATGEKVVVTKAHVNGAVSFLHRLYSYDNFGYLRLSKRVKRNRETAREHRDEVRTFLKANPRLLEFLLDRRGSFRSQDLEEMAHMLRDEVNMALGTLSDAKMISKSKSQIVLEPELHKLLKEIEDES